jgi:hypothetical protein
MIKSSAALRVNLLGRCSPGEPPADGVLNDEYNEASATLFTDRQARTTDGSGSGAGELLVVRTGRA